MARGPAPKPTRLKLIAGNPGKRPLNPDEPEPEGDLFEAPLWMNEPQRESWEYAIDHAPKGLLKNLDRGTLVTWVCAEVLHRQAALQVAVDGLTIRIGVKTYPKTHPEAGLPIEGTGLMVQHPALSIMNTQAKIMLAAAQQLGFTPASRTRIAVPKKDKPQRQGFAALRGGKASKQAG